MATDILQKKVYPSGDYYYDLTFLNKEQVTIILLAVHGGALDNAIQEFVANGELSVAYEDELVELQSSLPYPEEFLVND